MHLARLFRGLALLGLLLPLLAPAPALADKVRAGKLQAAMIYRLATFVEWPEGSLREGPFRVGVVGAKQVALELDKLSVKRELGGQSFEVESVEVLGAADQFDLLFVGASKKGSVAAILTRRTPNVLTMSDASNFAKRGGMIQLLTVGGRKIKFEVNRAASDEAGLRISSRLLELAAEVHTDAARD